jgi:alcohol dehydrogenase (cytochrome c)
MAMSLATAMIGAQGRSFTPVTDAMLRNPAPSDWLYWRGTGASQGHSPLTQIDTTNVGQLQLAWSWQMEAGSQQAAPIVYAGVMYLPNPSGIVQALDAATGDLLWEYRHSNPKGSRPGAAVRGLAIYDDKVYLTTLDARIVALAAVDGRVIWSTQVADPAKGFTFTAGAIAAKGKIVAGLQGCDRFYNDSKCAVVALDAKTGKEAWRLRTIAMPSEPGGDSWGNLEPMYRAGTDMWISGSYDPELNLVYWSTSQAKPWTQAARGTDGDALYSNSTLAINPDTGTLVWYHQNLPADTMDMDEVFENILVDDGPKRSVFKMGKLGVLWEVERRTGSFLRATDLGYQNSVNVNRETGKVTFRPNMIPKLNEEFDMCPSFSGVKSWRAMSYSPQTKAFYIPAQLTCQKVVFVDVKKVEGGGGAGQGRRDNYHHPASGENLGEFIAMDTTGKVLWKKRQRATFNTAALTTAGGLAFVGDWNRFINAYDAKTGRLLWQTRAPTSPQGFPISYAVNGRQYIAVPVGVGALSWGTDIPLRLTPEIKRPATGNSIMVFALPHTSVARFGDR